MIRRRALLAGLAGALAAPWAAPAAGPLARAFPLPPLPDNHWLHPLGGLEIDRHRLGFGGISGAHLAPDLTLTTIADTGRFAAFELLLDEELAPLGLAPKRAGWLHDAAGRALRTRPAGDAESLARLPGGDWLVGFERQHRISRYRDLASPARAVEAPPGLDGAPTNAGLETLAVLADGRWLAIAEAYPPTGATDLTTAWLGGPGRWTRLAWRPARGMNPTDATPLPDGGALVVERGFSWLGGFSARLLRLPAAALAEAGVGTVLAGEELLRLAAPLPVENYEAVAFTRHGGRGLVAVLSDDNESRLQRSLLLLFAWRA